MAEELVFGEITTGAESDLNRVSDIAKAMVMQYGMSGLGERVYGAGEQTDFLGRSFGSADYSEDTARKIDEEIDKIIVEQKKRVRELLLDRRDKLDALAKALLEHETVEGAELKAIFEPETQGIDIKV